MLGTANPHFAEPHAGTEKTMTETRRNVDHERDNATMHTLVGLAQRLNDIRCSPNQTNQATKDADAALVRTIKRIETVSQRLEPIDESAEAK